MLHTPLPTADADAAPAGCLLADRPGEARALVEQRLAMLTRLAEMGMQIAEAATRRAVEAMEGEPTAGDKRDPTLAYARAARAVRMCIALQARLLGDLPGLEQGEKRARYERTHARKTRILSLVDQAIEAGLQDEDEIEALSDQAREQIMDADEYSALMTLPLAEALARICRDLDVSPDWQAWGGIGEGPMEQAVTGDPFSSAHPRGSGDPGLSPIATQETKSLGPRLRGDERTIPPSSPPPPPHRIGRPPPPG
jgi:hypothetical protein